MWIAELLAVSADFDSSFTRVVLEYRHWLYVAKTATDYIDVQ